MAPTIIDPRNDEAMLGLASMVYTELVNGSELPKGMDAGQAVRQTDNVLAQLEITGIRATDIISYLERTGAATRHHREITLHPYDW